MAPTLSAAAATEDDDCGVVPLATSSPPFSGRQRRDFVVHYAEMVLAMFLGMIVLSLAQEGLIAVSGADRIARALDGPVVSLFLMTAYMVIGMSGWMAIRRHSLRHNVEMNAAMVAPLVVVVPLQIAGLDMMMALHLAMFASMLSYMWWRRPRAATPSARVGCTS
jgi:hypothetical protein